MKKTIEKQKNSELQDINHTQTQSNIVSNTQERYIIDDEILSDIREVPFRKQLLNKIWGFLEREERNNPEYFQLCLQQYATSSISANQNNASTFRPIQQDQVSVSESCSSSNNSGNVIDSNSYDDDASANRARMNLQKIDQLLGVGDGRYCNTVAFHNWIDNVGLELYMENQNSTLQKLKK